jgi:hypothetical protein
VGMAATVTATAVLPPRSAAVAMKTPASTAMEGAHTINNQQSTKSSDGNDDKNGDDNSNNDDDGNKGNVSSSSVAVVA